METESTLKQSLRDQKFSKAYIRGEGEEYDIFRYQYALTSHFEFGYMEPLAIIYPQPDKADEEVKKAINWASEHKVAIATRTGGHQYSGASSTYGNNIQLDMSEAYLDPPKEVGNGEYTVGISYELWELNQELRKRNLFVPHGLCSHVHAGGHCQTGGYGMLARCYGLFGDHIMAVRIITADGEVRTVRRNDESSPENRSLFYAVLGGSPGNFGVITHITLKPHKDEDHPNSRGLKVAARYNKDKLKKVLDLVAEVGDNPEFSGNVDFTVTVVSQAENITPSFIGFNRDQHQMLMGKLAQLRKSVAEQMQPAQLRKDLDAEQMRIWGKHQELPISPFSVILVYLQWGNKGGPDETFENDTQSVKFFARVREALGLPGTPEKSVAVADEHEDADPSSHGLLGLLADKLGRHEGHESPSLHKVLDVAADVIHKLFDLSRESGHHVFLDGPMHLSKMTRQWVFTNVREFNLPFEKRTYGTRVTDLGKRGWAQFVTDQADKVLSDSTTGCRIILQLQAFGGEHSEFYKKGQADETAYSWRDSTVLSVMDCFYNPGDVIATVARKNPKQEALNWQRENDEGFKGAHGICPGEDRRFLWSSYGDYKQGEFNMGKVWMYYHDNKDKYDKLCAIKNFWDPHGVFTPNSFCVGYEPPEKGVTVQPAVPHPLPVNLLHGAKTEELLVELLEKRFEERNEKLATFMEHVEKVEKGFKEANARLETAVCGGGKHKVQWRGDGSVDGLIHG